MKGPLIAAAVGETLTGIALVVAPALVVRLLLGVEMAGAGLSAARVAGLALVGLGLACWPGPPRLGMTVYGAAVGFYLAWLGLGGAAAGILLWPAVVLHLLLAAMLARA